MLFVESESVAIPIETETEFVVAVSTVLGARTNSERVVAATTVRHTITDRFVL